MKIIKTIDELIELKKSQSHFKDKLIDIEAKIDLMIEKLSNLSADFDVLILQKLRDDFSSLCEEHQNVLTEIEKIENEIN